MAETKINLRTVALDGQKMNFSPFFIIHDATLVAANQHMKQQV
jgi:hypothetical protein